MRVSLSHINMMSGNERWTLVCKCLVEFSAALGRLIPKWSAHVSDELSYTDETVCSYCCGSLSSSSGCWLTLPHGHPHYQMSSASSPQPAICANTRDQIKRSTFLVLYYLPSLILHINEYTLRSPDANNYRKPFKSLLLEATHLPVRVAVRQVETHTFPSRYLGYVQVLMLEAGIWVKLVLVWLIVVIESEPLANPTLPANICTAYVPRCRCRNARSVFLP